MARSRNPTFIGDGLVRVIAMIAIAPTASSHATPSAVPSKACDAISCGFAPTTTCRARWAKDHHVRPAAIPIATRSMRLKATLIGILVSNGCCGSTRFARSRVLNASRSGTVRGILNSLDSRVMPHWEAQVGRIDTKRTDVLEQSFVNRADLLLIGYGSPPLLGERGRCRWQTVTSLSLG